MSIFSKFFGVGKKTWIIPDCELPPLGEGDMKGHESVVILNDSPRAAKIKVTLYFEDNDDLDELLSALCGKDFISAL